MTLHPKKLEHIRRSISLLQDHNSHIEFVGGSNEMFANNTELVLHLQKALNEKQFSEETLPKARNYLYSFNPGLSLNGEGDRLLGF